MRIYHLDACLDLLIAAQSTEIIPRVITPPEFLTVAHHTQSLHIHIKGGRILLFFETDSQRDAFFKHYCQSMHYVRAAGGIVRPIQEASHPIKPATAGTKSGASMTVLMIQRRNKWDLPKGKIEAGESSKDAALREVEEETGLQDLTLGKLHCITYHLYPEKGHWCIKQTDWYDMYADDQQPLVPQTAEEITAVHWMPLTRDEISYSLDTFASIRYALATMLFYHVI